MGKVTIIIESDNVDTTNLTAAVNECMFGEDELAEELENLYQSGGTARIYVVPSDDD